MLTLSKLDIENILVAMNLTVTQTVWKSQDECAGYIKAIREMYLIIGDSPEIEEENDYKI